MPSPNEANPNPKVRPRYVKPTTVSMAVSSGTPNYEWKSVLFGLFSKKVGVAPVPSACPSGAAAPPMGNLYQQVRQPQTYVRVAAPQAYPYQPVAYYRVAP